MHKLQKIKLGVHIAQAVLIFVSWVMDIVVFRRASIDGRVGWHFGLVSSHKAVEIGYVLTSSSASSR